MTAIAFRLAYPDGDAYQMSEYGYFAPEAAENAASTLNRVRAARGREMYSHVITFAGDEAVQVRELEQAA
jgi:hypothetical protein